MSFIFIIFHNFVWCACKHYLHFQYLYFIRWNCDFCSALFFFGYLCIYLFDWCVVYTKRIRREWPKQENYYVQTEKSVVHSTMVNRKTMTLYLQLILGVCTCVFCSDYSFSVERFVLFVCHSIWMNDSPRLTMAKNW